MKLLIHHIRRSELAYPLICGVVAGLVTGSAILLIFSVARVL